MSETEFTPPKLLPPHYAVIGAAAIIYLGLYVRDPVDLGVWRYLGLLDIAFAAALMLDAVRQFAQAKTNIVPLTKSSALVTKGVFRFSRNPMYLGMILTLGGLAVLMSSAYAWLIVMTFALIIRYSFVRREEALMHKTFGDAYREYQQRTRRWI